MGWPIYVYAFKLETGYVEVYGGRSWFEAFKAARKAKREGAGCIKLEWR